MQHSCSKEAWPDLGHFSHEVILSEPSQLLTSNDSFGRGFDRNPWIGRFTEWRREIDRSTANCFLKAWTSVNISFWRLTRPSILSLLLRSAHGSSIIFHYHRRKHRWVSLYVRKILGPNSLFKALQLQYTYKHSFLKRLPSFFHGRLATPI